MQPWGSFGWELGLGLGLEAGNLELRLRLETGKSGNLGQGSRAEETIREAGDKVE